MRVVGAERVRRALRVLAPYLVVLGVVLVGNLVNLTVTDPDPLLQRSGLPISSGPLLSLAGMNTIDPNDGFTTQTLGVAAARQLIHGELPLWNSYEGLGQPLLAGMQSAALFPFVLLMLLPGGVLIFHLVLELIAGIGALLLLRRLGLSSQAAMLGGSLFALNGVFSWLTNAVFNPIAFLPWILLGIELARDSGSWRRARGWWLVAVAVALSLLAGFPEIAYLNGLLAGLWALVRLPGVRRKLVYLVALAAGVGVGVAIAAPALISFAEYLPNAWVGGHSGGFAHVYLHSSGAAQLLLPYVLGPIFGLYGYDHTMTIAGVWGSTGGYLTMGTAALAVVGLVLGRRLLALRIALAAWAVLCLSRIFGIPVLREVLALVPGGSNIAEQRYLLASCAAALIVLAGLGAEAVLNGSLPRRARQTMAAALLVGAVVVILLSAHTALKWLPGAPYLHRIIAVSALLAGGVVLVVAFTLLVRRSARYLLVPFVAAEAVVLFLVPQLWAPARPVTVDTAPVTFLQQNLGQQRYFGLGVIGPNYGSYFGIASLDENDLPVPSTWERYIRTRLNDWALPDRFDGAWEPGGSAPSAEDQVYRNLAGYEAAGAKYLVAKTGQVTTAEAAHARLTLAFHDAGVQIWELPAPAPYFSAPGCSVSSGDRDSARLDCATDSRLTRLELAYPGWHATVDGKDATLGRSDVFQRVAVPGGEHTVRFRYWPAHLTASLALAGAALALLIAGVVLQLLARRRAAAGDPPSPDSLGGTSQTPPSPQPPASHPESAASYV